MCSLERAAVPERLTGPGQPEVTVPEGAEVTGPEEERLQTGVQRVLVKLMDLKVRELRADPAVTGARVRCPS